MNKGSGSGIFPDPGDPKRLDPTGSGSATLMLIRHQQKHVNTCAFSTEKLSNFPSSQTVIGSQISRKLRNNTLLFVSFGPRVHQ